MKKVIFVIALALTMTLSFAQSNYELRSKNFNGINVQGIATPTFTDLDGDDCLDLIIGSNTGKMFHYEQKEPNSLEFNFITESFNNIHADDYCVPTFTDLDGDDLLDLMIGDKYGNLIYYEQKEKNSRNFKFKEYPFSNIDVNNYAKPTFIDLDGNGCLDLLTGELSNKLYHYEQESPKSLIFNKKTDFFNDIDNLYLNNPSFTDLEGDGLLDLIIGEFSGTLKHYEQKELNSLEFELVSSNFQKIDVGEYSAPTFIDLDGDGLLDLIIGAINGNLEHYEAVKDETLPVEFSTFSLAQSEEDVNVKWITQTESDLRGFYVLRSETEDLASANKISDLISASNTVSAQEYVYEDKNTEVNKRYWYWIEANGFNEVSSFTTSQSILLDEENQPEEEVPEAELFTGIKDVYPNPFNPPVNISFFIDEKTAKENANTEIEIYNARGQKVHARNLGIQTEGMHTISWNGNDEEGKECGSGIYFVKFTAGSHRSFEKSIKLK